LKGRFAAGVVVSTVLLVLLFWKVEPAAIVQAYSEAAPIGLVVAVVLHFVILTMKAARWQVVLGAVPHPPAEDTHARRWLTFDALYFGYFGNYVLPAKLGEVGRAVLYGRRAGVPVSSVLATILVERLLDAVTLISIFYAAVLLLELPPGLPDWVLLSARLVGAGALIGLAGVWLGMRWLPDELSWTGPLKGLVQKVFGLLLTFREGLSILREPARAAKAIVWTASIWLLECFAFWVLLWAFGLDALVSGAVTQVAASSFAIAAPSAPGGLGIHQWVTVLVLAPFGVSESTATAASLVVTFSVIFWVVPLGLLGLWRQGTSTAELRAELETVTA
jgi:glycosyltransferase 2 family protein